MSRSQARPALFAILLTSTVAAGALAESTSNGSDSDDDWRSFSWGLGLTGFTQQQPYAGVERENHLIPVIYFENRWLQLMGPLVELKLPEMKIADEHALSFGLGSQLVGFNGYEPDDAPILDGMSERESGIFAGPFAKWSSPFGNLTAQWMFDLSGNSDGRRIQLGFERAFHFGESFALTPGVAAVWLDDAYSDYYYGVRADEARIGRSAYLAKSTLNTELSLRADYFLDDKQALFATLQFTALGAEIERSPLVDGSREHSMFMGYLYRFR